MSPRRPSLALLIGLLVLLAPAASAAPLAAEPPALSLLGHYGGAVSAVTLRPPYAYAGVGNSLEVLDISDPAAPRRVGGVPLPRQVRQIALQGDHAYLTGESIIGQTAQYPLMVVEIARPEAPRLTSTLMPDGGVGSAITVAGRYAYTSGGVSPGVPGAVHVFDLADPAEPRELTRIGDLAGQSFVETAVAGPFLYGVTARGVRIYDVADPREANLLSAYVLPEADEYSVRIQAGGSKVYLYSQSESAGALRVLDVSDPGAPELRGTLDGLGTNGRIAFGAGPGAAPRIYLVSVVNGGSTTRLQVIDVSAPTAPRVLGSMEFGAASSLAAEPISGRADALAAAPGLVAMAGTALGLVSTIPEEAPSLRGSYAPLAYTTGLTLSGETLLLESFGLLSQVNLTPMSVRDPGAPLAAGPISAVGGGGGVLAGDTLYVPEFKALGIYARSPNGAFAQAGRLETAGVVRALAVRGTTAFLLDDAEGLLAVNVADPAAPARLDTLPLPSSMLLEIVLDADRAYVSSCDAFGSGSVAIVDTGDPGSLAPLGAVERSCNGTTARIAARGGMLYLHESLCVTFSCTRSLRVVDAANPAAPQERGRLDVGFGFASATLAAPGYLVLGASITSRFILDYSGEVTLVDVRDPAQPRIAETVELSSAVEDLAMAGPLIYAAGSDGGLTVLRAPALFAPSERLYLPLARR